MSQNKLRGITSKGFSGQFLLRTLKDDIVFVPCGSALPFVIRRNVESAKEFVWVGECYAHGITEGQAFDGDESSIEELRII